MSTLSLLTGSVTLEQPLTGLPEDVAGVTPDEVTHEGT
jgi:hypothetical protein